MDETEAAGYVARTLDALRNCGTIGALLWCFADYHPDLFEQPPLDLATHERTFGLWRADQTPKPAVAEVAARRGQTCVAPPTTRPWLDVTVEEFAADRRTQLIRLYGRYRAVSPTGVMGDGPG